jgi:xanthine/uracil permease
MGAALGGVVVTGVILAVVGLIVKQAGIGWINWLLPPVVTGTIRDGHWFELSRCC